MLVELAPKPIVLIPLKKRERDDTESEFEAPPSPKRLRRASYSNDSPFIDKEETQQQKEEDKAKKSLKREEKRLQQEAAKKRKEEEKQERARQRELEKQKKEEEKKKKEEERIQKQKEREVVKKQKEEEKQERARQRELEKQKKEEEKKKKEEERFEKQKQREAEKLLREKEKEAKKKEKEQRLQREEEEKRQREEREKAEALTRFKIFQVPRVQSMEKVAPVPELYEPLTISLAIGQTVVAPILSKQVRSQAEIDLEMKKEWTTSRIKEEFLQYYKRDNFPTKRKTRVEIQKKYPGLSCFKAFSFEERPPVCFAFRRKSKLIHGRRPLVRDESLIDYEVDSDEEWEEGGGEDIATSDNEQEDPMDMEEYDEFLVPDGYLSEDEGLGDLCSPGVKLSKGNHPCRPYCSESLYSNIPDFAVLPIARTFPITEESIKEEAAKGKTVSKLIRPVTEDTLPDLIRLLHNSTDGVMKIVACFKTQHPEVSKRQIEFKMKEMATKVGGKWILNDQELALKYCPPEETRIEKVEEDVHAMPEVRVLIPKLKKRVQPILLAETNPQAEI